MEAITTPVAFVLIALIMGPALVMISLIYFIRDMVQDRGMRQSEQDRIGKAQWVEGSKATIELVKELHHEIHNGLKNETVTAPVTRPARTESS
jgi:hypothetical protein